MENSNTDTQCLNRGEIRDSVDFWMSIDYQKLVRGEIDPVPTNEELEDRLGLSDRGIDFILKRLKHDHSHNT